MKKRILATLLSLCLVVGLLPVTAMAADDPVLSGYCGADASYESQTYNCSTEYNNATETFTGTYYSNAIWTLTENGTLSDGSTKAYKLTISGTGAMGDFGTKWAFGRPWHYALAEKESIAVTESRYRITAIEISDRITVIGAHTFEGYENITSISLPDSVTKVGENAFNWCKSATSLSLGSGIKVIEKSAFNTMVSITSVSLPESLETIGSSAFGGCTELTGKLIIPNSVKTIGDAAFASCKKLTGITIGNSVISIGSRAFSSCQFAGYLSIPDSVTTVGEEAFMNNSFTNISLGNGLVEIGKNAFYDSGNYTGLLLIPDSTTTIGNNAFQGLDFNAIRLGKSVQSIGNYAFMNCTSAHSLDVTSVGSSISYGTGAFGMAVPNTIYLNNDEQKNAISSHITEGRSAFAITNGGTFAAGTPFKSDKLAAPAKEGYTFGGWYSDASFTKGSEVTERTTISAGNIFYAKWTYNVAFDGHGATSGSMDAQTVTQGDKSTQLTSNGFSKTGYTFAGWNTQADGKGTSYAADTVASNVPNGTTLYAQWKPDNYTLNYNLNGGTVAETNPATYTIETPTFTLNNPTKTGYTFSGWTWEGNTSPAMSVTIAKGSTGAKSYTANWSLDEYTISYELNGGSVATANPTTYSVTTESITLNNPTKTGYTFKGWSGTDLTGDANTTVAISLGSTGNRSYTANWTPNTYTISFDGNGATGGSTDSMVATYDVSAKLTANGFTKTDMKFMGWAKTSGGNKEYDNGQAVSNLTAENGATVTLYAVWAEKDTLNPDVTPQHKTYNGEAQAFTLDGGYTITYQQNSQTVTPVNAGTYDVVITKDATDTTKAYSNTVTGGLVIDKADVVNTTKDSVHHTFGTPYDVSGLFNIDANAGAPTYALAANTAEGAGIATLDGTTLTITKAGTINVTLTTAATENYKAGAEITATLHVDKIEPKPTIKANGKTALTMSGGGTVTLTLADVPDGLTVTVNYINEADSANVITVEPVNGVYSVTFPNESATYTFSVETGATDNYDMGVGNCTVTVTRYSSSGSSSSSNTSTSTTKNPDGSTTTTTTNKTTGTVTEVTKDKDGTTTTVETKKDGTVTETVKTTNGTTGTVVTDKNGDVTEVKSTVSSTAAREAAKTGEAVTLPVEVPAAKTTEDAPAVQVTVPKSAGSVKVEVPVEKVTPGTVAVIVKADGTEEIVKTSIPTENGVALKLDGSATVKVIDNAKDFSDTNGHWAEDAISFVTAREMFAGTTTTTFTPNSQMTRAQLMTVLARFDGVDTNGGNVWYEKGMEWAKANGVSDGSNPNGSITREQLATMLWRYSGSPVVEGGIDSFNDAGKVNGYASDAMRWAVETGLIGGIGNNTLAPQGNATRAQLATILMRYCENIVE